MQKIGAAAHQPRRLCRVRTKNCVPEAPEPRTRAVPDSELFPEIMGAMAVDKQTKTRARLDRVETEPNEDRGLRFGPNDRSPIPYPNSHKGDSCSASDPVGRIRTLASRTTSTPQLAHVIYRVGSFQSKLTSPANNIYMERSSHHQNKIIISRKDGGLVRRSLTVECLQSHINIEARQPILQP